MQNNKNLLSFKCSHCSKSNEFCEVNSNCEKEELVDSFLIFEKNQNPNIPKKFYIIKNIVNYIISFLAIGGSVLFIVGIYVLSKYDLSKSESNFYIDFLCKILNIEKIDTYTELFKLYFANLFLCSSIFLLFFFIEFLIDCYVEISAKKETLIKEKK